MWFWEKLTEIQFQIFSNALKINDNEFIIVPEQANGIYKYKLNEDTWTKIMDFELDFKPLTIHNTAYDESKQLLYLWQDVPDNNGSLLAIDLNQKTVHKFYTNNYLGVLPPITCINSCVHIMGLGQHLIFDQNTKQFTNNLDAENSPRITLKIMIERAIEMQSTKRILSLSSGCEYITTESKWNKLNADAPNINHLAFSAIVKSQNERFIIILGGLCQQKLECVDTISVYDTHTKLSCESSIKTPVKGWFTGAMMHSEEQDDLLTFGFVHECYKSEMQSVPYYIIKLIGKWICLEHIHLVGRKGNHWRISLDDILVSIQ